MENIPVSHHRPALIFIRALILVAVMLSLTLTSSSAALAADKAKAEEVIAKHLEALGSNKARSTEQSRVAVGTARLTFKARNSSGTVDGQAVLGSVNRKVVLAMAFDSPNYPGEKFGFDGKKLTIGYLTPGVRSPLGNFILSNSSLFKEGLMGGTLSSAWPLLNLAERSGSKVEYAGTDKVNGQPAHKLRYTPKGGSDVNITLYFDEKTFHHIRTQYEYVIASRLSTGGVDRQANQTETRYKMVEDFSDYKKEGELTLPHSYTLQLEITKTNGSSLDKWEVKLEQFAFNQEIDDKRFDVEGD